MSSILILSVILTGMIAYNVINGFNIRTNESRLMAITNLISAELSDNKTYDEIKDLIDTMYENVSESIRFTVIDVSGKVLYDNVTDAQKMENHMYRTEVKTAILTKKSGQAIRESTTLNIDEYYYASYNSEFNLVIRTSIPMVTYMKTLNDIRLQFIIILGISLVSLVIIGIFIASVLTRPLINLKKAANEMSAGNYSSRVISRFKETGEVGEVSMAFNKMADQLQNVVYDLADKNTRLDTILNSMGNPILAIDGSLSVTFMNRYTREEFTNNSFPETGTYPLISVIRNSNVEKLALKAFHSKSIETIELDMDTRKGVKKFRVIAIPLNGPKTSGAIINFQDVTQIQKLQQLRSEFVANVTHELKTPLTSIRGFVDTLRQGAIRNPEVSDKFLEIIDVEAERLHKLINDILSLSEIEDMSADLDTTKFDLNSLIDEVLVLLDDEAFSKHISLITEGIDEDSEPFMVNANRNRIKQVLINLIENAIKYNIDNGKVFVHADRNENNDVIIHVRDTGNGISKEHLPRIFERFYRVDKSRSKELGGTGLGLSIVKHISMLYGGNATANSTIGEGSEFVVTLKI